MVLFASDIPGIEYEGEIYVPLSALPVNRVARSAYAGYHQSPGASAQAQSAAQADAGGFGGNANAQAGAVAQAGKARNNYKPSFT